MPGADILELSFRKAAKTDVHDIVALVNSAYRGESSKVGWTNEADLVDGPRTDAEDISRLVETDGSMILICLTESEIAGCVHLEKVAGGAYLGMLAIKPSLQGGGIGKRFMEAAELAAREAWGAEKIMMTVITARHELIAFYERRGYKRTGEMTALPISSRGGLSKVGVLQLELLEKRIC